MGQALYRKYRSKSLGEIVGQEHVTATLKNALKQGRISHAYLLSGPRGTGKTSVARILAHEINGLPYDDTNHLDIIEIDAASNRRIDEIRDLRDKVNTAPTSAKYKVYIIDEVHMLTKEAFNALLKTLEEPPAHVVFILATTEAHKLPETIISRTQRYSFRPVPIEQVAAHLKFIAKNENITIDENALELIAEHGDGSFRDSISLLDQASSAAGNITRPDIERMLGLTPEDYINRLGEAVAAKNSGAIVTTLTDLYAQGFEPAMIASQLSAREREGVLNGTSADPGTSLLLLQKLLAVPADRSPKQMLEIILLQHAFPVAGTGRLVQARPAVVSSEAVPAPARPTPATTKPRSSSATPATEVVVDKAAILQSAPAGSHSITDGSELWQQAIDEIKKQYNTLYGIARMAKPEFDGDRLILSFKFAFHQKRLSEAKNRKILGDIVERLYGKPVDVVCIIAEPGDNESKKSDVSTISNIFGGAELLES